MDDGEPAVLSTTSRVLPGGPSERLNNALKSFILWGVRHNRAFTIAAASTAPVLYLLFIDRFATNAFRSDDWSVVPFVHSALHGHLSLSLLWSQYNESRLVTGSILMVLFGFLDRLDLRSVMFCSAALFIASYAGLLILVRRYLGKPLTPVPVLIIGVIWFSLADVQNALWAFQVSWYATVFFFLLMLLFLLVPKGNRILWFALAVFAAIAGSLSTVQGFSCWPIGAICILWNEPWARRTISKIAAWLTAACCTVALFLRGFKFGPANTCIVRSQCTPNFLLHHPLIGFAFFFSLVGNVIPGGFDNPVHNATRFEAVGLALTVGAVFILLQSWRHRTSTEHLPLPLLLIVFSLVFDATITAGRGGTGSSGAVNGNRFVMANLVLLTGIVIYAWAHMPIRRPSMTNGTGRVIATYLALLTLGIVLVIQVTIATGFGLTNGRVSSRTMTEQAQVLVYAQRHHVVGDQRLCQLETAIFAHPAVAGLSVAISDQLGEFNPNSDTYYRDLGLPPVPAACQPLSRDTNEVSSP